MTYNHRDVHRKFAARLRIFYVANLLVVVSLGLGFFISAKAGYYRVGFFASTAIFLLWIFNANRLRRCPSCENIPCDKEGIIGIPKICVSCGQELFLAPPK